ncbi:Mitochondrial 2-oxoglutarate/malate carrier protein [Labeo rohita]|uniref:Mitochondrial 2-oxoglutarate/malate carrier protein n=2 Tax=Labeonini TaxID=2743697 RepID=A0ABQ8MMG5_LABRO|nr:Mitochondrial 2-oxoglutarate/malate carrier protein [Labeo rohita]
MSLRETDTRTHTSLTCSAPRLKTRTRLVQARVTLLVHSSSPESAERRKRRCPTETRSSTAAMAAAADTAKAKPKTSPKSIKFLFGGLAGYVNAPIACSGALSLLPGLHLNERLIAGPEEAWQPRDNLNFSVNVTEHVFDLLSLRNSLMGATVFVQPLDLVKNRMQLSGQGSKAREYRTSFHAVASILRNEGIRGIYTGLSAGLLRQATYTTTRLGIYTVLFERMSKADGTPPNFFMKALIGMTAGATGAFVGTPAEVALIRMTADGRLPPDQRRGYTNVFNALIRITREEGVTTLWRVRVCVCAPQLASYSQSKQALLDSGYFRDDILCHFCASMISGLVTTAASMPVDIVKTRIQNMRMIDGKPEYKNGLDVLVKVIRKEGFFSLWKGFTPYYARLGPHTVLTFIFLEQMNKFYKIYFLDS